MLCKNFRIRFVKMVVLFVGSKQLYFCSENDFVYACRIFAKGRWKGNSRWLTKKVNFFDSLLHEFLLLFSCVMKAKRLKLFKSFFLRRMAAREIERCVKRDRPNFFRVVFFRVVFRFFWSSEFSFPIEFDSKGFHPGCKCKGSERDEGPTAEPKPESRKSEDRSILRHKKGTPKAKMTPRSSSRFANYAIKVISDLERPWVFCSGASCIMLAVSTLR